MAHLQSNKTQHNNHNPDHNLSVIGQEGKQSPPTQNRCLARNANSPETSKKKTHSSLYVAAAWALLLPSFQVHQPGSSSSLHWSKSMASLLLLLRAIVGVSDKGLLGVEEAPEEGKQPEMFSPKHLVAYQGCRNHDDNMEEERWLVTCLRWSRTDRQSAWMQMIWAYSVRQAFFRLITRVPAVSNEDGLPCIPNVLCVYDFLK